MMNEKVYQRECPSCHLSYKEWIQSVQMMFRRRFGYHPRDQQIVTAGSFTYSAYGKKYVHGSLIIGSWVYEFDFCPVISKMFVPEYGYTTIVTDVDDWVLEQIWHS